MHKPTRLALNTLVIAASLLVGLLACEAASRLLLNPADYLSAATEPDDVLGIRVAPGTRGFDAWGFRNPRVPSSADIVAIGDSHTYGNNATMKESWPSVVAEATGRTVYNLGLGGYGPNQYAHLLATRAVTLKPRLVLCGLYMGDDFENAFLMTYGVPHWSSLRAGDWTGVNANIWSSAEPPGWGRPVRVWLSRNSILYQQVVHGPVLGRVKGFLQISQAARGQDEETTSLILPDPGIREAFRPLGIRARLDQRSAPVREGMRITLELLAQMDRTCRAHGCRLVVVLIPTKETVFADYLLREPTLHLRAAIADLIADEQAARNQVLAFLDQSRISHVDTLPALRRKVRDDLYTRSDRDMHPGRNGYRVIGEAVAEFVR